MQIDSTELERLIAAAEISDAAREIARANFTSAPARSAESGPDNVASRVPDPKTGQTVEPESRLLELKQYWELRKDPSYLHFVSQPAVSVRIADFCTPRHTWQTVADFFGLQPDAAGYIETRTEERIKKVNDKHPGTYMPVGMPGEYECPAAQAWCEDHGVFYRVRTPLAFKPVAHRNAVFLDPHSRRPLDAEVAERVRNLVIRNRGITVAKLAERVPMSDILGCIAHGAVYVDIERHVVADYTHTPVYADALTAAADEHLAPAARAVGRGAPSVVRLDRGGRFRLAGSEFEVELAGLDDIVVRERSSGACRTYRRADLEGFARTGALVTADGGPDTLAEARARVYEAASPRALERATRRAIALGLVPASPIAAALAPHYSVRHLRRLRARQAAGLRETGDPLAGLIPAAASGGGRHLDGRAEEVTTRLVTAHTLTTNPLTAADIARLIREELRSCGLEVLAPSERTIARRLKRISRRARILAERGRRGANGLAPVRPADPDDGPPNGERVWDVGHLDALLLDIELRCAQTGRNLGRVHATVLVDGYSGYFLAVVLHFEAPSAATALRVLRACVARWGRLPDTIVVDQGPEFHSTEFQAACAWVGVTLRYRPTAQPRFGSPVERAILELNRIVWRLRGHTRNRKNPRGVDGDKDAAKLALWDLATLRAHIDQGIAVLHEEIIQARGDSRRGLFERSLAEHGVVTTRILRVDDPAFQAWTLPLAPGRRRKVHPVNGISVTYITYWHDVFARPELDGAVVDVRRDPDDVSHVYAFAGGTWIECLGREVARLRVVSAAEWQVASAEIAQRSREVRKARRASGAQVARLIADGVETERLLLARLRAQAEHAEPVTAAQAAPGSPVQAAPTVIHRPVPRAGFGGEAHAEAEAAPVSSLLDDQDEYDSRWWQETS